MPGVLVRFQPGPPIYIVRWPSGPRQQSAKLYNHGFESHPYFQKGSMFSIFKKDDIPEQLDLNYRNIKRGEIIVDPDHPEHDGIVNRLKLLAYISKYLGDKDYSILVEAADELERLQLRNDYLIACCETNGVNPHEYCRTRNDLRYGT